MTILTKPVIECTILRLFLRPKAPPSRMPDAKFLIIDELGEDRRGSSKLFDVEHDVAPDCVVEYVTRLTLHGFDGRADCLNEGGQVARSEGRRVGKWGG